MGTNYYMVVGDEKVHIGKASVGHAFLFNGQLYDTVDKWKLALKMYGIIEDEYGKEIPTSEFLRIIERNRDIDSAERQMLPGFYRTNGYYFYDGEFS